VQERRQFGQIGLGLKLLGLIPSLARSSEPFIFTLVHATVLHSTVQCVDLIRPTYIDLAYCICVSASDLTHQSRVRQCLFECKQPTLETRSSSLELDNIDPSIGSLSRHIPGYLHGSTHPREASTTSSLPKALTPYITLKMREVNFSIPNVNKAAVHITTTLYDRRALDCTSTLPLINSLNHLAYLTTSSARIRDILTVDGGVERLVCILKEGRSKDNMEMWKWNLAFQCVVNIGVRGSEAVRTRVVEADIVPVIATILGNYIQVVDRQQAKAKAEADAAQRSGIRGGSSSRTVNKLLAPREPGREQNTRSSFFDRAGGSSDYRQSRRQAPPPSLDIPQPFSQTFQNAEQSSIETTPTPHSVVTSPPERTTFARPQLHHHNRSHDGRGPFQRTIGLQPPTTAVPSMDTTDGFSLRPVRDADRLPSMLPALQTGITSNPESPTTPVAPLQHGRVLSPIGQRLRRPSVRHQLSTSDASEDTQMEDTTLADTPTNAAVTDGREEVQSQADAQAMTERDDLLQPGTTPLSLTIPLPPETQDNDTVDITQTSPLEPLQINGLNSIIDGPPNSIDNLGATQPTPATAASPAIPLNAYPHFFLRNATSTTAAQAAIPRDEDVLMSLQLLAYISKYCDLRQYFQATHLVPRLKIDRELQMLETGTSASPATPTEEGDEMEEFLQPDDYNISPLVEKFTVRHHSKDMQYWACVVMRNLCRKDESKGGIRQCAWYKCGRWEEYVRQFAKCRRCRRTKYCSKECQRESWPSHR
jgi:MYND finger